VILGVSILTYGTIVVLLCFSLILCLLVLGIFSLTEDIALLNIFGYACTLVDNYFPYFHMSFHFSLVTSWFCDKEVFLVVISLREFGGSNWESFLIDRKDYSCCYPLHFQIFFFAPLIMI
jgi:hypothetical protein